MMESIKEKLMEPMLPTHIVNFVISVLLLSFTVGSRTRDTDECGFDASNDVCSYGISTGVFGFLIAFAFAAAEVMWERIPHLHNRMYIAQMLMGLMMALSFIGTFLSMVSKWISTDSEVSRLVNHTKVYLAIIFALIGSFTWAGLVYLAYLARRGNELSPGSSTTLPLNIGTIDRLTYRDHVTSAYEGPRDI